MGSGARTFPFIALSLVPSTEAYLRLSENSCWTNKQIIELTWTNDYINKLCYFPEHGGQVRLTRWRDKGKKGEEAEEEGSALGCPGSAELGRAGEEKQAGNDRNKLGAVTGRFTAGCLAGGPSV